MNHFDEHEIRDLLTPDDLPTPPLDLAARIKAEIPHNLAVGPAVKMREPTAAGRPWHRQGWLLAASLVTVLGGVWLAGGLLKAPPEMAAVVSRDLGITSELETTDETAATGATDGAGRTSRQDEIIEAAPPPSVESEGTSEAKGKVLEVSVERTLERGVANAPDLATPKEDEVGGQTAELEKALAGRTSSDPEPASANQPRAFGHAGASSERTLADAVGVRGVQPPKPPAAVTPPPARAPLPSSPPIPPPPPPSPPPPSYSPSRSVRGQSVTAPATPAPRSEPLAGGEEIAVSTGIPPKKSKRKKRRERAESAAAPAQAPLASRPPEAERSTENRRVVVDNATFRSMEVEARELEEALLELELEREISTEHRRAVASVDAVDAMTFRDYGNSPFVATEIDPRSTFALDVDTGSYNLVRRYLNDGRLPPASAVRVEEMINRFNYGDAPPAKDDFALYAEGSPVRLVDGPRRYLLRLGVQGREVAEGFRPPADLVFVVDVSGSMARENRLGLVRQALGLLVDQLGPADRVALVVYGTRGQVVLPLVADHNAIRGALDRLQSNGSTNAEEGLRLGFELALEARRQGTISRVILCSDGVANVGRTGPEGILSMVRHATNAGVELTTVGFGMGNYNDELMEQLADQGNGRYAYVDDLDEARRIFVESLTGTLLTIAAEAKAQVVFNPEVVARYRLIGYENRDVADEDFRNDAVDAGEIGAGHAVTALYEIDLQPQVVVGPGWAEPVAEVHLRWGSIVRGQMTERALRVTGKDFAVAWDAASPSFRWCALVARLGEQLRGVYGRPGLPLAVLHEETERLSPELFGNADFVAFRSLVAKAAALDPSLR